MSESAFSSYTRIVLLSIIVALLGLSPRSQVADDSLADVNRAISNAEWLNASRYLAEAGTQIPWRYDLNLMAGRYAWQAGDAAAAIRYFERHGTRSHLTYDDLIILADAYAQTGEAYVAEALWKHMLELKDSSTVRERLVELYRARKDYPAFIDQLKALIKINPSDLDLYYQVGTLYAATDPLQALPYLAQAAEMDTVGASNARLLHDKIRTANLFDNPAYTYLIAGRQLANSGNWSLAEIAFMHAIELEPNYADAWAFLGESRGQQAPQHQGDISTAGLYELDHALQLDPKSTLVNTLMGLYWERHQDYAQAQLYLHKAIQANPADPFLYTELGSILSKAGDLPAAQTAYETAIQTSPDDPLFYRMLAEFALYNQIQIREVALPAARQAILLDPDDPSSLDLIAQVMLAQQDYHSAERYLLSALQAVPDFAPAILHLGTVYLYLDEPDQARHWLNLAQFIEPESWINAQAKRMLEYYFP